MIVDPMYMAVMRIRNSFSTHLCVQIIITIIIILITIFIFIFIKGLLYSNFSFDYKIVLLHMKVAHLVDVMLS